MQQNVACSYLRDLTGHLLCVGRTCLVDVGLTHCGISSDMEGRSEIRALHVL